MTKLRLTSLAAAVLALPVSSLHAAALASDNAGNYNPNANYGGLNNGTGFGAFVVSGADNTNNTANSFLNTSNNNGFGDGNIDTNNLSFGLFANSGSLLTVNRSFLADAAGQAALATGQTFSVSFDNGYVTQNNVSTVGFNLLAADNTDRFTFQFVGGGQNYVYNLGNGVNVDTGVGFTSAGLSVAFTQGAANAFTLAITPAGGATTTINGVLTAAGVTQFQAFDNNAGTGPQYDVFFNNLAVVPEPGMTGAVGVGALALWLVTRRRRRA